MSFMDVFRRGRDTGRGEGAADGAGTFSEGISSAPKIGAAEIKKAAETLKKYKASKANLEKKLIANEQFWKLRQWEQYSEGKKETMRPASAWLWNCIVSKHADFMDGFPSPNIIPRMADDEDEARRLSSVMPIILDQCDFRRTYDDVTYYKLKQGTGVYGIFWDSSKNGGLGDIAIKKVDLLKLFWEPGITDIQDSASVFLVDLIDNDILIAQYPEFKGKIGDSSVTLSKYLYDDSVDTSDKTPVIDWYYKRGGALHFCKFAGETVLYSSENEGKDSWYAHGKYPFVCDTLFSIEGTIAGYGYTDIGKDVQREIDILNEAILKNAMCGARPRYFTRRGGAVNEKEFADWSCDFVHTEGSLGEDAIRPIDYTPLQGNYLEFLESKITELKEVTGNRDVNTGGSTSGITAASAIAAMQEAGSKQSRDGIAHTYNAYREIVYFCIELMRERYDMPRYFRILGEGGDVQFVSYDNAGLRPQSQGMDFGIDMGMRTPEFDIEVTAEKASPYKKMEMNELALQLYGAGVFNPMNADQALALLQVMDFAEKDKVIGLVRQNGTAYELMMQYQSLAYNLAAKYEPETARIIGEQMMNMQGGGAGPGMASAPSGGISAADSRLENVRNETQERTQPT